MSEAICGAGTRTDSTPLRLDSPMTHSSVRIGHREGKATIETVGHFKVALTLSVCGDRQALQFFYNDCVGGLSATLALKILLRRGRKELPMGEGW